MTTPCSFVCNFSVVIVLFQVFRYALPWIFKNIVGPKVVGPKVDVGKMGDWALVTGATDGIGKAYAMELAKKGLNLILVSRSKDKLENVGKEITEATNVQTKIIDVDFTDDLKIYEKIEKNIHGLNIGVLVNNVGMSYSCPEYFLDIQNLDKFLKDIISCNIHSVTHMCKLVMPGMVERKKGVVINIASMSGTIPNPLLSIYSATKAFVDKFSQDLGVEYKDKGIIVQSVLPGFVVSNMSKLKSATWISPSATTFAQSALSTVGIAAQTTGYLPHALMKLVIDGLTFVTCTPFANYIIFNQLKNIRKRYMKRITKTD